MTLTEFLLDRIHEDEAAALNVPDGPWFAANIEEMAPNGHVVLGPLVDPADPESYSWVLGADSDQEISQYVARFDPARVLAECQAKRRIVEHEQDRPEKDFRPLPPEVDTAVLRLLALPHSDHPDYDESWRP